jgi:HK97 family phage major capsid protein
VKYLDIVRQHRAELAAAKETALLHLERAAAVAIDENRNLTPTEAREVDRLRGDVERFSVELRDADERVAELEAQQARTNEIGKRPAFTFTARDDTDNATVPQHLRAVRDHALRNVDASQRTGLLPAHAAEKVVDLVERGHPVDRANAMRWAAAAGDPAYASAFSKLVADPERGHMLWSPEEQDAYRRVQALRSEERAAMSTTGANGGHMIPLTLDPAVLLTSDGSNNPLRRLARVVTTTTNTWQGVTSAGATAEWKTEGSQAGDGAPTFAAPSIPTFLADCFVGYSFEVGMDALDFNTQIQRVMLDALDNLEAVAFTTGDGVNAPQGIVTGLVGGASEINTTGSEAISSADPYALQSALPARFSANAAFMSHIAIANLYRQLESANGALLFPELRDTPPTLLGKPWYENSNMDGAYNAAATANNYVMVYGDVRAGFIIVDRVGATVELVPHLFGANGRPTGQRGLILWKRTGSEVVVPQALRLLDVPTTA